MTPQRTKQAIIALTRLSRVPGLSEEVDTKIQTAITQLVDSAPEALNTLNELAAALNDNENAYNTLMGAIQSHDSRRDNPHRVTKEQVGLGSLPNARSDKYDPSESEPVANSTSSLVLATTRAVSRLKDYLVRLIQVGDQVQSLHIPQLTEENYTTWTGALEGASKTTARVISKTLFPDQPCLRINGELRMTAASEYVFCRRSTETHWQFLTADELQQGDYLLDSSLEAVRITTIATEKKPVPVGHINVEPDDLFFAHGLLIHNTEPRYK